MLSVIKDEYISVELVEAAKANWPGETDGRWFKYPNGKLASMSPYNMPRAVDMILQILAEFPINKTFHFETPVFPDLDRLHGAGMHHMPMGVSLGLHRDTERHPTMPWKREVSIIAYLDEPREGGELDLTDASGNLQQRIASQVGRVVAFTTPGQFHRVNPASSTRRSICLFFWSICDPNFQGTTQADFVDKGSM